MRELRNVHISDEFRDDRRAHLQGYHYAGDYGGGEFRWDPGSTDIDDGGTVVQPDDHVGPGRWMRVNPRFLTPQMFGANPSNEGQINTLLTQRALNALRTSRGGELHFPPVTLPFTAIYDMDRDDLPEDYSPNYEQRRAHKALVVYDADNITISGVPGSVIDRSNDAISDTAYAPYAATIYVSRSSNITIRGLTILGTQNDSSLLQDIKGHTSGDNICINSGSRNVTLEDLKIQDGTSAISVGVNRTSVAQSINPTLAPCTDITISDITVLNHEHGLLLADCERVHINNFSVEPGAREDGSSGVIQRGVYIHSARDVTLVNTVIGGTFKTGVLISDYKDVKNIAFTKLTIKDGISERYVYYQRGKYYTPRYEGIGIQLAGIKGNMIRNVSFDNFSITGGHARGVVYTNCNFSALRFVDGEIEATHAGFGGFDYRTTSNRGIAPDGLTLQDVTILVTEDRARFPNATPVYGLLVGSTQDCPLTNLLMKRVRVRSQTRNARIYNTKGNIVDCTFGQITGYSGARNYDLNIYNSEVHLSGNAYETQGAPNKGSDSPGRPERTAVGITVDAAGQMAAVEAAADTAPQ